MEIIWNINERVRRRHASGFRSSAKLGNQHLLQMSSKSGNYDGT